MLYPQDMSIDVYGRKEDDDAPQEEAPSSSNGVRALTSYTMDPKRCINHLGNAMCRPSCLSAASMTVSPERRHSSRHQRRKTTMTTGWTTCLLSDWATNAQTL